MPLRQPSAGCGRTTSPCGTTKIVVRTSDDIQVAGVNVAIRDQDGAVLEQGAAVKDAGGATYTYTATTALQAGQAVSIEVTATDLPGNSTTRIQARA